MPNQDIPLADLWPQLLQALSRDGALLVVAGEDGTPNAMTIGGATAGRLWGRPVLTVLIRPLRYTFALLEETGDFTVNILSGDRAAALKWCGTVSGRDHDKLAECGLTAVPSRRVRSPILAEAVIHFECRVIHKNDINPAGLDPGIAAANYPRNDFHRVYFGEVLAAYANTASDDAHGQR